MPDIGIRELKTRVAEIVREVREQRARYVVTHQGRPVALLLPEVAAAICRGRGDVNLAREFAAALERLSHLVWVPLDIALARHSADAAARYRLRGSDAVYAAVALRFGSVLVTLDREQREQVGKAIVSQYPAETLAEIR